MCVQRALWAVRRSLSVPLRALALAIAAVIAIAALASCTVLPHDSGLPDPPDASVPAPTSPVRATLTVERTAAMTIPSSFLGLSTEYWTLPVDERHIDLYRRIISLLRVAGDSPFVLRIGGDSSDHTFYAPGRRLAPWAFALTPAFVTRTATVVRSMRLHVILDLNLITGTPGLAAAWAREAETVMPRGSIVGFEIGNEPDLYERTIWLRLTGARVTPRVLPHDITAGSYATDFDRWAEALEGIAPGTPLLGPALSHPRVDANWITALLAHKPPRLRVISVHEYPYSACAFPGTRSYPTVGRVLSQRASAGLAASVAAAVAIARRAGLPVRVTEFNSVTCGGLPGVSNTFATALWAPDAAFELLAAGAQSIDLHAREYAINDPFTFTSSGVQAHPLMYGLILFTRALSAHAHLLRSQLHVGAHANVKAWAVGTNHGTVNVLVLDKGARGVHVTMNLPASGVASIQRLTAGSPRSTAGVRLDGQWLNHNGAWVGRRVTGTVRPRGRRYQLWIPRYSAALLTVRVAAGR